MLCTYVTHSQPPHTTKTGKAKAWSLIESIPPLPYQLVSKLSLQTRILPGSCFNLAESSNLGDLYAQGHGVAQNYVKATAWYRKAAAKGDAVAMNTLGSLYENGDGVLLNFAEARKWYERAAAKGEAMALLNLGDLYRDGLGVVRDYARAQECYDKARSLIVIDRFDELRRR
jgi:TPR repeat protein